MCFIISQPRPWPLRCERTRIANSASFAAGVVVQAHHAEHAAGRLVDGDEGHGVFGIVVDELVDQLGAHFAHGGEKAQPQILRGHLAEEIRIERGIRRLERPEQHAFRPSSNVTWSSSIPGRSRRVTIGEPDRPAQARTATDGT